MRPLTLLSTFGLALLLFVGGAQVVSRQRLDRRVEQASAAEALVPQRVLWVWERPEDLRGLDPSTTGVAVLEETLRLGSSIVPVLRHQPVLLPEGMRTVAMVRIEAEERFSAHTKDAALLEAAVAELDRVARRPGIAALQIDFDARKSERAFYRALLEHLRERMPAALPLEMTALVSWCSTDDWLSDLPVNAATPMFFRMEPDRRRLLRDRVPIYEAREPLCQNRAGVSTAEPWPAALAGKRVFVFPEEGWAKDLLALRGLVLTHAAPGPQRR